MKKTILDGTEKEESGKNVTFLPLETPGELKRVRKIADEVWPETYRDIITPEQIRYMMEMMYSVPVMEKELFSGVFFDLCLVDGEDAGYTSFSACPDEPGTAKLHKVYLLERFHGQGIGQKMLAHACARCREKGFSRVILAVNKRNVKAQKAYARAGFAVRESVCKDIGEGFVMDDYIMGKTL